MPQFKCAACGAGLYSAAAASDLIDPGCSSCGSRLDVGGPHASRVRSHRAARTRTSNPGHQRIVDGFAQFMARGRPDEVASLGSERWLDDGGSFSSAAVAEAQREPTGGRT
jgi:hypothetical protein